MSSVQRAESLQASSTLSPFLLPTRMCDVNSEAVQEIAKAIAEKTDDECQRAVLAFEHAQNAVAYRVGIYGDSCSETLKRGYGSCSNKANVLVGILRALQIPAGFGEIHVNGKDYLLWPTPAFGDRIERCKALMSEFKSSSRHFFVLVSLRHRWLRCDPSDDLLLAYGGRHCLRTLEPVVFDGISDACLCINPSDILLDWSSARQPIESIDFFLQKKQKAPPIRLQIINIGLDFIRKHGAQVSHLPPQEQIFACYRYILEQLGKQDRQDRWMLVSLLAHGLLRVSSFSAKL